MADEISAGKISFDFTADLSDLHKAFADARQSLSQLSGGLEQSTESMGTFGQIATIAAGVLGADLVTAALDAAKSIVTFGARAAIEAGQAAEQFEQLSQRTGVAVDSLQGLQVAMAREGLAAGSLALGFRTLSQHMVGVAEGSAKSIELFSAMNISAETVAQGTGSLLSTIADRFAGMADGAEKSRLAVQLFGRAGLQLIPILNQGSAGLDAAMKKAEEFGLILTKTQQTDLTTFDDAMDDLQSSIKGFTAQVGAAFAPALTALIHAMTTAVVAAKNVFVLFADAAEKLMIRAGALVATFQLLGRQLFSFSVLSKDAWVETFKQVEAIDAWAAAQIKAVDNSRTASATLADEAKAHLTAGEAVKTHTDHQKILGEQIVSTTKIQLHQIELLGQEQERMGAAIVSATKIELHQKELVGQSQERIGAAIVAATKIELKQRLEANQKFFEEVFAMQEEADRANYLAGPEPGMGSAKMQEEMGRRIIEQSLLQQKIQRQTSSQAIAEAQNSANAELTYQTAVYQNQRGLFSDLDAIRSAANNKITADLQAQQQVEALRYQDGITTYDQYQNALVNLNKEATAKRMGVDAQYPSFFKKQLQGLVASNSFSISQIVTTWTGGLANSIVKGGNFVKQAWESTQIALVQGALNTGVQLAAEWALRAATEIGIASTTAVSVGAINAAKNSAIIAGETATAGATTSIWAGATTAVQGYFAMFATGLKAIFASLVEVMVAVGTAVMGLLKAIAAALTKTVFGIPWAGAILVGIVGIVAALIALKAIKFKKGGIVTGPTLGMMGEAGSEATIPLNERGAKFMQRTMGLGKTTGGAAPISQTIILELDGRTLMRYVANQLPSSLRLKGLPA